MNLTVVASQNKNKDQKTKQVTIKEDIKPSIRRRDRKESNSPK